MTVGDVASRLRTVELCVYVNLKRARNDIFRSTHKLSPTGKIQNPYSSSLLRPHEVICAGMWCRQDVGTNVAAAWRISADCGALRSFLRTDVHSVIDRAHLADGSKLQYHSLDLSTVKAASDRSLNPCSDDGFLYVSCLFQLIPTHTPSGLWTWETFFSRVGGASGWCSVGCWVHIQKNDAAESKV